MQALCEGRVDCELAQRRRARRWSRDSEWRSLTALLGAESEPLVRTDASMDIGWARAAAADIAIVAFGGEKEKSRHTRSNAAMQDLSAVEVDELSGRRDAMRCNSWSYVDEHLSLSGGSRQG